MKIETLLPLGKLDPGLAQPDAPLDLASVAEQSRAVDRLGYDVLLMEETKDDPFQVLALAATNSQNVHIGTSVAIAFARSPFVTAMSAWTAQKISGGRFELGLGSQVRGHIRRRYGQEWRAPVPWMRDYVGAVKALWHSWQTATPIDYSSSTYSLNLSVPLFTPSPIDWPIPIQIAAVNPLMCALAAEVADGIRLHPVCSADYIRDVVEPALTKGRARRASQAPSSSPPFDICLKPLIATAGDERTLMQRREIARQRLAFYVSTPAYRGAFDRYGLEDLANELALLAKARRWTEMAGRINDNVLEKWVLIASYDELAGAVNARYGDLIDRIELSIPIDSEDDAAQLADIVAALHRIPVRQTDHGRGE